jgi:hypothetical protein
VADTEKLLGRNKRDHGGWPDLISYMKEHGLFSLVTEFRVHHVCESIKAAKDANQ